MKTDVSSKGHSAFKASTQPWSNLSSALQPAAAVQDSKLPAQQAADVAMKNDLRREAIMAEGNLQHLLQQLTDAQGMHVVPSYAVLCQVALCMLCFACCALHAVLCCAQLCCAQVRSAVMCCTLPCCSACGACVVADVDLPEHSV